MKSKRDQRRSEKVRQRLKKESKSWINQASHRLTDSRKTAASGPQANSGSKKSVMQQAEKHNYFFRIGWRVISFALAIGFAYGIYQLWNSPQFLVSSISINGLQRIDKDEVLEKIDITGQRIFMVNTNTIREILNRTYPELWDIRINLNMPNQVKIKLTERQPMIIWDNGAQSMWIDAEGYLIPARNAQQDLLVIKADSPPAYQLAIEDENSPNETDEEKIQTIIRDKPQIKGELQQSLFFAFPKKITSGLLTAILQLNAWMPDEKELLYEAVRGVGWEDARGWNVFIGSKLESINDKMLMYETIVRNLEEKGIQPNMVSVEFLHAPYFRLDE